MVTQMPAALKQAAAQLEYYHTFSGVFPQIHRAWMTIDHILFLWDYTDPRGSFYQYDGLDQTIIHASLVRPRAGVFEEGATPPWLLLLSTPVEVVLLGLYTNGTEIDIYETGFSVPTDGASRCSESSTTTCFFTTTTSSSSFFSSSSLVSFSSSLVSTSSSSTPACLPCRLQPARRCAALPCDLSACPLRFPPNP